MNTQWQSGKIFLNSIELDPHQDLSDEQAQKVFKLCLDHQNLKSGNGANPGSVNLELPKEGKVVFFPGSFSPWHKGHRACVANLPIDRTRGEKVIVLPDFNPWKEVRDLGLWSDVQGIWKGLASLASEREDLTLSLYLGFLADQAPNPTVSWLPDAVGDEKWLLMGEDTFLALHKWKEVERILSSLHGLYVCPRKEDEASTLEQRERLLEMSSESLQIEFLASHPYQDYSSTWARTHKK